MTAPDDGAAETQDLARAIWGLFVGLALMLVASGLFGTLLGVRSELRRLPTSVSGLISAAYYGGFLLGSRLTLGALQRVGHIRVYAALASLLSAAILGIGMASAPLAWAGLRFLTGMCIAGQYVVAESWLNDLADNTNRGRLLSIYTVVTSGAFGLGQLLLNSVDARALTGFALASILTSLAVAPVTLSEADAPTMEGREHVSLRDLARIVPTGVGSCFLTGVAHGGLTGMAAIYAIRVGLSPGRTALFVAAPTIGGVILQWPIAGASDDVDRRAVGIAAALGAAAAGGLLLLGPAASPMAVVLMAVLGGASYPLYSIAAAYTNDWVDPSHVNAAASQLVTLYGLGAIVGPFLIAVLMTIGGPRGFYWALIAIHLLIVAFLVHRRRVWRSPLVERPWSEVSLPARVFFIPATVVAMGRRNRPRGTARRPLRSSRGGGDDVPPGDE